MRDHYHYSTKTCPISYINRLPTAAYSGGNNTLHHFLHARDSTALS